MATKTTQRSGDQHNSFCDVLSWILAGTLSLTPLVLRPGILHISSLPKFTVSSIGLALALVAIAVITIFGKRDVFIFPPKHKLPGIILISIFMLFAYAMISGIWATNLFTYRSSLLSWAIPLGVFSLISLIGLNLTQRYRILCGLVIGAGLQAGMGLIQFFFDAAPDFQRVPPGGSFLNKNFAASYSVIAVPAALVLWIQARDKAYRLLWFSVSLVLSLFIFHAFSRASWLAALIAFLLTLFLISRLLRHNSKQEGAQTPLWREIALFLILFFAGTFIGQGGIQPRILEVLPRLENALQFSEGTDPQSNEETTVDAPPARNSFRKRLEFWANISVLIRDRMPLGVGQGNFEVAFPPYANAIYTTPFNTRDLNLEYAHNEYLEVASELGLFGILALACLILASCGFAYTQVRRDDLDPFQQLLIIAAFGGAVAIGINTMASSPLNWPAHKFAFMVCLGLLAAPSGPGLKQIRLNWLWAGPSLLITGLFIAALTTNHYLKRSHAETLYQQSGALFKAGQRETAIDMLIQANDQLPFDKRIGITTGGILIEKGQFDQALKRIEPLAQNWPYDFKNNQNLANTYLKMQRQDMALTVFERMHAVVPDDITVSMKLAVLLREKDWQRSDALLDEVLHGDNSPVLAYLLRAENAMLQGDEMKAAKVLVEGGKHYPGNKDLEQAFYGYGFEIYSIGGE